MGLAIRVIRKVKFISWYLKVVLFGKVSESSITLIL